MSGLLGAGQPATRPETFPLPSEVPAIGALVEVVGVDDDHWLGREGRASRVEDLDVDAIAVAAPRGRGDLEPPEDGQEIELRWPSGRGVLGLRVRIVERYHDGVALWWCEPAGPLVTHQRRAFVRARAGSGRVHVTLGRRGGDVDEVDGFVVDLSEGGLRASVGRWSGEEVEDGTEVAVRLTAPCAFDDDGAPTAFSEIDLVGTVLRWLPPSTTERDRELVDVSVEFWQPVPQADALRKVVFAWQRAERRRGVV